MTKIRPVFASGDAAHGARPWSRIRRGGSTAGLVVTLAIVGAVGAVAIGFGPRLITAGTGGGGGAETDVTIARADGHQRTIEMLGSMVARSREVIAIHTRTVTPYLEVVLWLEDGANLGAIDPDEVAVLSHSTVLQTVWLSLIEPKDDEPAAALETDITSGAFCTAFRERPDVVRRVLATGVANMTLETRGAGLRLGLTWDSDSADGSDDAAVLIDARRRTEGAPDD